jgi:hypothetical protein
MALKQTTYTSPLGQELGCQRVGGREGCCAACGVSQSEMAFSADLGGSSKYSNENIED